MNKLHKNNTSTLPSHLSSNGRRKYNFNRKFPPGIVAIGYLVIVRNKSRYFTSIRRNIRVRELMTSNDRNHTVRPRLKSGKLSIRYARSLPMEPLCITITFRVTIGNVLLKNITPLYRRRHRNSLSTIRLPASRRWTIKVRMLHRNGMNKLFRPPLPLYGAIAIGS